MLMTENQDGFQSHNTDKDELRIMTLLLEPLLLYDSLMNKSAKKGSDTHSFAEP